MSNRNGSCPVDQVRAPHWPRTIDVRPHGRTIAPQRAPAHEPSVDSIPVRIAERIHRKARGEEVWKARAGVV